MNTTKEILEKAKAELQKNGWISYGNEKNSTQGPNRKCVTQAFYWAATQLDIKDEIGIDETYKKARAHFEQVNGIRVGYTVGWNDNSARTIHDVYAAIDKAIETA